MGVVHFCENAHLLRHRSEHICTSAIYYEVDLVRKTLHCKTKYMKNLQPDSILHRCRRPDHFSNLPKPLTLVYAPKIRPLPLSTYKAINCIFQTFILSRTILSGTSYAKLSRYCSYYI